MTWFWICKVCEGTNNEWAPACGCGVPVGKSTMQKVYNLARPFSDPELAAFEAEGVRLGCLTYAWLYQDGREVLSVHGAGPNGGAMILVWFQRGQIVAGEQSGDETSRQTVTRICRGTIYGEA